MDNLNAGDLLLWRLLGPPGPPITQALTVAEAARDGEIRLSAATRGTEILPDCLHGPGAPGEAHRHAFRIPLDRDGDGRIDHLAYHIPGGLCLDAAKLLAMLGCVDVDGWHRYALVSALPDVGLAGPARRWRSVTPFFGPDHSRRKNRVRPGHSAGEQLMRELGRLGRDFPSCEVTALAPRSLGLPSPRNFWLGEKDRRKNLPGRPEWGYYALSFEVPVAGPIAAGYGAHFGLGCFLPDRPLDADTSRKRVGKGGNS